jgi:NAD-dependent dihydropyrimidine dehydrogenase PreA subunit
VIEIVSNTRCVACDLCVRICPTNVFDGGPGVVPTIARQEDCQTCFMCEAYCPTDALWVAPFRDPVDAASVHRDEEWVEREALFGSYRERLGWGRGRRPPTTLEHMLEMPWADQPLDAPGSQLP